MMKAPAKLPDYTLKKAAGATKDEAVADSVAAEDSVAVLVAVAEVVLAVAVAVTADVMADAIAAVVVVVTYRRMNSKKLLRESGKQWSNSTKRSMIVARRAATHPHPQPFTIWKLSKIN
jgi:hypothetical protein